MAASNSPVVLVRHRELVTKEPGDVKPIPPKSERLVCACGHSQFFVTRVDFVCCDCSRSYRD